MYKLSLAALFLFFACPSLAASPGNCRLNGPSTRSLSMAQVSQAQCAALAQGFWYYDWGSNYCLGCDQQ